MHDELLEAFFSHGDPPCDGQAASRSGGQSEHVDECLTYLHGPVNAGLASLLLQFGFTQAKRDRDVVLVLFGDSSTPPQLSLVPIKPCSKCGEPVRKGMDGQIFQRIQIKYFRTHYELQHFLCSFHLAQDQNTSVLLISSFEQFFAGETHMTNVMATMAYLYETLLFIQRTHGVAGQVVISGLSGAFLLRERHALRRWCRFLETIPSEDDDDEHAFLLQDDLERSGDAIEDGDYDNSLVRLRYEFLHADYRQDGVFHLLDIEPRPTPT